MIFLREVALLGSLNAPRILMVQVCYYFYYYLIFGIYYCDSYNNSGHSVLGDINALF